VNRPFYVRKCLLRWRLDVNCLGLRADGRGYFSPLGAGLLSLRHGNTQSATQHHRPLLAPTLGAQVFHIQRRRQFRLWTGRSRIIARRVRILSLMSINFVAKARVHGHHTDRVGDVQQCSTAEAGVLPGERDTGPWHPAPRIACSVRWMWGPTSTWAVITSAHAAFGKRRSI